MRASNPGGQSKELKGGRAQVEDVSAPVSSEHPKSGDPEQVN